MRVHHDRRRVLGAEHVARWSGEQHVITARRHRVKLVMPRRIGRGRARQAPRRRVEPHRHAGQAGLAAILDAVGVEVLPDEIANEAARRAGELRGVAGSEVGGGGGDEPAGSRRRR